MAARGGYAGGRRKTNPLRIQQTGGKVTFVDRRVIDQIKEATGATEEDIQLTLTECGGDVNEATEKLIESPFTLVVPKHKKAKQQEERKKADRGGASRGNGNSRLADDGTARAPKQSRGPDGRGGSQNYNGQRLDRGRDRARGGGGVKNAHHRHRAMGADERKAQEGRVSNDSWGKENHFPEGGTQQSTEPPAAPAAPRNRGYADALCKGIGQPKTTQAPTSMGRNMAGPPLNAYQNTGIPEPVQAKVPAIPSASAKPHEAEEPTVPETSEQEESSPRKHVETPQPAKVGAEVVNPPTTEATVPSVSEPWGSGAPGPDAPFGHVGRMLPESGAEENTVKVPNMEPAQAQGTPRFLPVFRAPDIDLSLESIPSFKVADTKLHFGSFMGVESISALSAVTAESPDEPAATLPADSMEVEASITQEQSIEATFNEASVDAPGTESLSVTQEVGEDIFPASVSAPVPEKVDQMLEPICMDDVGALTLGDAYSQHVPEEALVETKADAATQVVVQEPEPSKAVTEPSYASTGVQHTTYIPSPALSVTAQSAVPDYGKAVEKTAFQAPQFAAELSDQNRPDMKPPQQTYGVEEQVPAVHQHRQQQHQQMPEQRSTFETGQHTTNPSPTLPPYQHRQKQDDRGGPPASHSSHAQQPRFNQVGQVSTGAQTDPSTIGNQAAQVAATNATSSSGPPAGAAVPPIRPGPTPSPHGPQVPYASPILPNPAMPFPPHYYHQYVHAQQYGAMPFNGYYPGTYSYNGGFSHGTESTAYPAPHIPPGGAPKYHTLPPPSYGPGVGASSVNQGYGGNYPATGMYGLGANAGYEASGGVAGYTAAYKDKDNLPGQPGQQHSGYGPGIGQQVPRNDVFYAQGYSAQGFRSQGYHHQGYGGQFGTAAPPNFHNAGGQQNNFSRLH